MESKSSPGRGCIFCGGRPLSKEHVWPQWIRKVQGDRGMAHYRREIAGDMTAWRDVDYNLQVKAVCKPCNHGWMSDLETAVQPILSSLIVGNGRNLYRDGQRILATWATKTAMMFQSRDLDDP